MTIKTIITKSGIYGTNAERLAMNISSDDRNIIFYETDTSNEYEWKGSGWVQTGTDGAKRIQMVASDVTPVENTYLRFAPAVTTSGVSATPYTSGDVSAFNHLEFEIYQISGTTPIVTVYPTYDGTNYSVTPLALINLTTGAIIAGATGAIAIGNYAVISPCKPVGYKIVYAAAVAGTVTLRGAHTVA